MSTFKQLLTASYNGIEFLVPDETRSGGKKTVDHEYPSANKRRFVEELGARAGVFDVSAIVHGSNAIQRRIALESELDKDGRGLLIHPSYGQVMVVATDYSSSGSDQNIGEFKFTITFKESEENITLSASVDGASLVSNIAEQTKTSLDLAFIDQYKDITTPYILQQSTDQLNSVLSSVEGLYSDVDGLISANVTDLESVINTAQNTSSVVTRSGALFGGVFRDVFNAFDNISGSVSSFYSSYISLTTFGNDRISILPTTQKRIDQENNLSVFEDLTRVNALVSSYEAAVYADYDTTDDLQTTKDELESTYDNIVATSSDTGLIFNPDVKSNLNELRSVSRKVFDQKAQNTWRVVDLDTGESSLSLSSYQYYKSIDNIDTLANLNPDINYSIDDNTIKGIA